jgi:hypothetical protein
MILPVLEAKPITMKQGLARLFVNKVWSRGRSEAMIANMKQSIEGNCFREIVLPLQPPRQNLGVNVEPLLALVLDIEQHAKTESGANVIW